MRAVSVIAAVVIVATVPMVAVAGDFETDMSLRRNDLRNEYRKVSRELSQVESEIAGQDAPATVSGPAVALWAVRDANREHMHRLTTRRGELRSRHDAIEREFRELTAQVAAHYGSVPIWWGGLN
jgi:hypothetical protein